MLAPAEQIEELMGRKGIDNSMLIVVYDNNDNMDSARLWWTLKYYGNDNVKVVSGGLNAPAVRRGKSIRSGCLKRTQVIQYFRRKKEYDSSTGRFERACR